MRNCDSIIFISWPRSDEEPGLMLIIFPSFKGHGLLTIVLPKRESLNKLLGIIKQLSEITAADNYHYKEV
ncbi:MAG: hypothetical protein UT48_C0006G0005 [Parcubacteria group bacterium GW2011_GWE2_39_37]|uniref:Uncharacterized protein n=1 Tax=Candidatus Falkowbacteria bacterium GW2011_GWF2_39_8 TaxID=1618642 RepID=A0A0G0Q958_9BACT|nr:MAG: hypothetical protein UT48_C0006G0005 [Parcubacteria group bacterium GW2011_GWE2_39_37]KKR33866.1 MAG: hypothetical protein UT64_C0002G0005 [Candidatus Falkowbacteria bacterium GW2011_GWF2_39_8]